jgi:hypothetical protein
MMIRSTYHTVLNASPGAAKLERVKLFDIPFIADWRTIGDYRQRQTDLNNLRKKRIDYEYKVGNKILVRKKGILRKHSLGIITIHGPLSQFIRINNQG